MSLRYPTQDSELKTIVRDETSCEDTSDELPDSQLDTLIERAKATVELRTGSDQWYSDNGLGFALASYTCMRAKAAVENIVIESYSFGSNDISFRNADPEGSQQIVQWKDDVRIGLEASDLDDSPQLRLKNSTGYIGETYYGDRDRSRRF